MSDFFFPHRGKGQDPETTAFLFRVYVERAIDTVFAKGPICRQLAWCRQLAVSSTNIHLKSTKEV